MPFDWLVSRVCEEFGCLPSQAIAELETDDELVLDVIDLRAYARIKDLIDHAQDEKDIPKSGMVDWVFAVQAELMKRRRGRE